MDQLLLYSYIIVGMIFAVWLVFFYLKEEVQDFGLKVTFAFFALTAWPLFLVFKLYLVIQENFAKNDSSEDNERVDRER